MRRRDGEIGRLATAFAACCAATLTVGGASAQPLCSPTFGAEDLDDRWTLEVRALGAELAERSDVDHCTSIDVRAAADGVLVVATLFDGRSTTRRAATPADLRATLTALLLVPAGVPATAAPPSPGAGPPGLQPGNSAPSPVLAASLAPPDPRPEHGAPARAGANDRVGVELGASGGARWSGGYSGGAVGGVADVTLGPWLVGVSGRWESYDGPSSSGASVGYAMQAFAIGAEAGYAFRVGPVRVALIFGPSLVELSQSLRGTPAPVYVAATNPKTGVPIGEVVGAPRDGHALRVGGAVRCTLLSSARLRLLVSIDSNVDMTSNSGNQAPQPIAATGPLPTWSGGLSLGAAALVWP